MQKIYSIKYSGDGTAPPTPRTRPAIIVPAGQLWCQAVPAQREAFLGRLTVSQAGGASIGFTVEVFDSKVPYPPGGHDLPFTPVDDARLYRILPPQTVAAGDALELFYTAGEGPRYHNQDGTYTDSFRLLYLVIIPDGAADDTTWNVAITTHHGDD